MNAFVGVTARHFAGIALIPGAIRSSLNPKTEAEAQNVQAQLDFVRANLRLLDYALPLVGAIIVFVHGNRAPFLHMAFGLAFAVFVCLVNEGVLLRGLNREKTIADIARKARIVASASSAMMTAWGFFSLSLWIPPATDIFPLLILSCSLAAVATMFSPHAASAAGAIAVLSLATFLVEFVNSYSTRSPLITLAFVYTALMIVQSCMIHKRFTRAWKLEESREELIGILRKAKLESDEARTHAVAASRAKSEFLANMSHELRTPLNAIIGFSEMVKNKAFGDSADKYSEYGGFINQSGHHLLDLIGGILDLAKIDAGRKVLHREPIDLGGLIVDEVQKADEAACIKGVSVGHMLPPHLPLLRADPHALRQVLGHLLSNAVKFTPEGGQVEVSTLLNDNHEIELVVADTGTGIAIEDQERIFDRFGGWRPEVTTAHRGTGMGLAIVKGLIDIHGGRIALKSALGMGTTISVTFAAKDTVEENSLRVA